MVTGGGPSHPDGVSYKGRGATPSLLSLAMFSRLKPRAGTEPGPYRAAGLLLAILSTVAAGAGDTDTEPAFDEVAAEVGLGFVHYNFMSGKLHLPEMMGPAVAV